ncbi:MAG: methyltransferase domain-containing protein, partial [Anaerolineae bacterium]|nr:methyltransferase domain-containing protein [Anaerolineae bacterium]
MPTYTPETLIARLKRQCAPLDPAIEAAFRAVPRHVFLPGIPPRNVYRDESIPLKRDERGGVTIASTQPSMTARMLAQLELKPGHNVLQVGAGSGYTAALIQHIVGSSGRVTAIEIDRVTAAQAGENLQRVQMGNVNVVEGDGTNGYAPRAQYDRIIVNGTIWDVPVAWVRQLKSDGILVAPLWLDALQYSAAFRIETKENLHSESNEACAFVPLRGSAQGPGMTVRIGGSSLMLTGQMNRLDSASLHLLLSETAEIDYLGAPLTGRKSKRNFLPFFMLHLPPEFVFCLYDAQGEQQPYGMNRRGFVVLSPGSAAFVSLEGDLRAWVFGGADEIVAAQDTYAAWLTAGMPGDEHLRVCLVAHEDDGPPAPEDVHVYPRT